MVTTPFDKGQFPHASKRAIVAEIHFHRFVPVIEVCVQQDYRQRLILVERANDWKT
jgi:hypothetical protein